MLMQFATKLYHGLPGQQVRWYLQIALAESCLVVQVAELLLRRPEQQGQAHLPQARACGVQTVLQATLWWYPPSVQGLRLDTPPTVLRPAARPIHISDMRAWVCMQMVYLPGLSLKSTYCC